MKKILASAILCTLYHISTAQLGGILKQKAAEGVRQGTQTATEKAVDKTIDKSLGKIFNGKKNKKGNTENEAGPETENKKIPAANTKTETAQLKTYSKYDFIPGEKIIVFDDFMQDAVGDFPAKWNTNASGEIMTVDDHEGHWLNISKEGMYLPKSIKALPENFTLEYDILFLPPEKSNGPNTAVISSQIITMPDSKKAFDLSTDRGYFELDPYMNNVNIGSYTKSGDKILSNQFNVKEIQRQKMFKYHIAVWRQKTRLRVYLNETKVVDAPSILADDIKYNAFRFAASLNNDGSTWLISNFKLASGLPDTRNKLLTAGAFSTTGILFATNSSSIQPQSYGTLKDIANVLKENIAVKIKITGYTDSDGDDAANLELSKKRAAAVKDILAKEFGIDESRMQTDGKGEAQPAVPNANAESKAQNRRVEFIKM
jgi:OmpA-OmpF porin, OOP family